MTHLPPHTKTAAALGSLGQVPDSMPHVPYTRAGSWPKPKSAECRSVRGIDHIVVAGPDLHALDDHVPAAKDLLLRFTNLEFATGEQIAKFAAEFGRLGDNANAVQPAPAWWNAETQLADSWRWWAGRAAAALDLLVALRSNKVGNPASWRVFADNTPPWKQDPDPDGAYSRELAATLGVDKSVESARYQFTLVLNVGWLADRVIPLLNWEDEAIFELFPGSVIGAVAMRLVVAATGRQRWTRCAECTTLITPSRVYSDGRENYCDKCRRDGAPQRQASRRYRNRKRRENKK